MMASKLAYIWMVFLGAIAKLDGWDKIIQPAPQSNGLHAGLHRAAQDSPQ